MAGRRGEVYGCLEVYVADASAGSPLLAGGSMRALELKVPPMLLAMLLLVAMWGLSWCVPHLAIPAEARVAAALLISAAGGSFITLGVFAFRRFRTTVDPTRPGKTTSFVSSGVYRVTRNPMYLGALMLLVAWAIFLAAPWAFSGPVFFFLYINRFQIKPEERILAGLFGEEYSRYVARVRRWL
ncbi:MAG: isoprenylcysteine carboxylmethyltransferase family protein [Steroidobacteraceae bacterium]|nr:isoprenylcysteine carboxylmethyltransferase family protein [Steroidobacteraceae bacterium]